MLPELAVLSGLVLLNSLFFWWLLSWVAASVAMIYDGWGLCIPRPFNEWHLTETIQRAAATLESVFIWYYFCTTTGSCSETDVSDLRVHWFFGYSSSKKKIMSSFTHPQFVPNLYYFFLLLNTKEDILNNVGNQTVDGSHSIFFILWVLMATINCYSKLFKISSFVFIRSKNVIQV